MTARAAILGSFLTLALGAAGGCAHTKNTDQSAEAAEPDGGAPAKQAEPEAGKTLHAGRHGGIPVASAPEALLAPGAEKKIREKLEAGGFMPRDAGSSDAAMREGLRKFQKDEDLPVTGVADHETVKRLGLDPDQIFRHGSVKD